MEHHLFKKKAKDARHSALKVSVAMKWKTRSSRDRSTSGRKSPRSDYSPAFRIMSLPVIAFRSISSARLDKNMASFENNGRATIFLDPLKF